MFSLYVAFATILFLLYPDISFCLIFGVRFLFLHIICVLIFIVFYGFVPQFFTILKCRGTLALISTCFAQHIVCIRQKCTQTFHFSCFLGYTYSNYRFFCTTYSLCSSKTYPDISFLLFFGGTHAPTAAHFTQHMVCTHKKMYPDISSFHFLGYACPNHHSFHITNI